MRNAITIQLKEGENSQFLMQSCSFVLVRTLNLELIEKRHF